MLTDRMTPKRLHVMLDAHSRAHTHAGARPDITGLTFDGSLRDGTGLTSFCVNGTPLCYDAEGWWHVTVGDIPAELAHEPRAIGPIHAEIRRVLVVLRPSLPANQVDELVRSGWLAQEPATAAAP